MPEGRTRSGGRRALADTRPWGRPDLSGRQVGELVGDPQSHPYSGWRLCWLCFCAREDTRHW